MRGCPAHSCPSVTPMASASSLWFSQSQVLLLQRSSQVFSDAALSPVTSVAERLTFCASATSFCIFKSASCEGRSTRSESLQRRRLPCREGVWAAQWGWAGAVEPHLSTHSTPHAFKQSCCPIYLLGSPMPYAQKALVASLYNALLLRCNTKSVLYVRSHSSVLGGDPPLPL